MVNKINSPSSDILERICDAHWNHNGKGEDGITFHDIYQHDACNHTLSGTIDVDGISYGFVIENGNMNGTVVQKWGLADDIEPYTHPEPKELLTFIPNDLNLRTNRPGMYKVYLQWRKEDWFIKKNNNYLYDKHFQPGTFIETHYRDWAAQKGMKIGLFSEVNK